MAGRLFNHTMLEIVKKNGKYTEEDVYKEPFLLQPTAYILPSTHRSSKATKQHLYTAQFIIRNIFHKPTLVKMVSLKAILTLSLIGAAFATPIEQRAAGSLEEPGAVANSTEGDVLGFGGSDPNAGAIEERDALVRNILRQLLNSQNTGLTIISRPSNAITWLSRPPRRESMLQTPNGSLAALRSRLANLAILMTS